MENVMFVALLSYCLLITAITDDQVAGDVQIENCTENVIDIVEQANNTIVCRGFNPQDTIMWTFRRNGLEIPVAICKPSHCTVHQPDHFAVERSPSHSTLFYQQYDREVDTLATVTCESHFGGSTRSGSCTLNVINPAELSRCAVKEDTAKGTVTGSCHFEHAFSFNRYFNCTWYQEKVGQSRLFPGNIEYDSSYQGPSGWCTFTTTWEAGTYIYSIDFYPGPGKLTVDIGNTDTYTPNPTLCTTPATSSPKVLPPANNVDSTSSPDVFLLTTKDSVDYTSPRTQEENDLPLGAIVGGIVAVVAVIIVVVVVVVVCVRKKRKQKPAGSAHGSSNDNATENDDFEEHVSPTYSTSDGQDASQDIYENTYTKPAGRPPNVEPEHVYTDLQSNTATTTTTTTTTTPSDSIATTTGDLHNTIANQHRGQGKKSDNVHHNPVYVNDNPPGEESAGVQQHPTYTNDHHQTAQGYVGANRDSNPYYSEIRDTGIN